MTRRVSLPCNAERSNDQRAVEWLLVYERSFYGRIARAMEAVGHKAPGEVLLVSYIDCGTCSRRREVSYRVLPEISLTLAEVARGLCSHPSASLPSSSLLFGDCFRRLNRLHRRSYETPKADMYRHRQESAATCVGSDKSRCRHASAITSSSYEIPPALYVAIATRVGADDCRQRHLSAPMNIGTGSSSVVS